MTESLWYNFKRLDLTCKGREATLIVPDSPNENKNWLFKTEYFHAFPEFEAEMVKRGWHLAYIKNITRWCLDSDLDLKREFATYLHEEFGLYEKCIPVGMSCGGLIASKLTAKYPEMVSALYLDAPVMNLLSCPAGLGKADYSQSGGGMMEEMIAATGLTLEKLISYRENPIDKMHLILKANIPVIMVYGDSDVIVPYDENGAIFEKYYRENGGIIEVIGKKGCGHHPHGLSDHTPLIEFAEKYAL